jgi:type II secretion system protein D
MGALFLASVRFRQNSWLTGQTLPIIPVMPIVAIAPLGSRFGLIPLNRVQLIRNMRSNHSKIHREMSLRPIVGRMTALALVLSLCPGAMGQFAPQSSSTNQTSSPATAAEPKVEAYPLTAANREILTAWQQRAAGRTDMRVAIDDRTSQALVFAPPSVQAQIQQELAAKNAVAATPVATSVATPNIGLPGTNGAALFQLKQLPAGEVHQRLEGLLSHQLPATVDASGEWQSFRVETSPGVGVAMSVNTRSSQVRIDGPPAQVAAWRSVVDALDSPPAGDKVTKIVNTQSANHDRVRKALEVLKSDGGVRSPDNTSLVATIFEPHASTVAQAAPVAGAPGQPAAPTANPQQPATQIAPSAQSTIDAAKLAEASGLLGPVQVEFVEGLDVIVLRGSERDVQRVMEIIKQIEELSAVTVPTIQIYQMKNVDSIRMGALLQQLYAQVLGPRIGTVSITPLGTPNALLLIGRAENVKMALELIERLDQPIVPTARFEVFPLKHANAAEAKTLIDGFLGQASGTPQGQSQTQVSTSPGGTTNVSTSNTVGSGANIPSLEPRALIVADPRTNSLIVSAGPRDVAEVAALIARIDTPGAAAELKVFTVANGDATALRDMLAALFSVPTQSGNAGGGGGGGNANEGGGGLGQGGPVRMQFSVDQRTNSIIAVGSREDLVVVESILLRLDQGDLRERKTTVYRLNNAQAQAVAVALNEWLQTQKQAESQPDLALSPFEQIEREVIIVPEGATNSLIISATPRFFEEVVRVVKELDERPPMVLIQVLIAQVQLNDTDQFGVELGLQDSVLFDRSLLTDITPLTQTTQNTSAGGAVATTTNQNIVTATGAPGFNFNSGQPIGNNVATTLNQSTLSTAGQVGTQALTNFAVNRADPTLGFGGFVFSASSDAVSVLLRALQEKRRVEVLSRPQLMALDGQVGYVQVGQDVPTVQGVNQTAFGQTNTITYRQVGLILQVLPRISPDGLIVMQINANKSQVSNDSGIPISVSTGGQVVTAPRIDVSQAITTISALSGQTVILGGLLETSKNDIHRRVPIIADIPLIGDLFRYDSVSEERRELLIILTPQIIYTKTDSDLVKQIESSRMSWILSDVINLHGEAGLRSRCDEWYDGEMESVYPNFVPQEGFLPLSKGQLSPTCAPGQNSPSCAPGSAPASPEMVPANGSEPIPTPRQSPAASRPANSNLGASASTESVQPARYLAPPLELPSAGSSVVTAGANDAASVRPAYKQ